MVRARWRVQKLHEHARSAIFAASCSVSSASEMFPQWQLPRSVGMTADVSRRAMADYAPQLVTLAGAAPGKKLVAAQRHALAGAGIFPGPDRGSMQFGQVTKSPGGAAEVARQRADVVPASADQLQGAGPRQLVGHESRLVQVDPR